MDFCCIGGLFLDICGGWGGGWLDTGWGNWGGFLGVEVSIVVDLKKQARLVVVHQRCVLFVL